MNLLFMAMALAIAVPAHAADNPTLTTFMQAIVGSWNGNGTEQILLSNGAQQISPFSLTVTVNAQGTNNWAVTSTRLVNGAVQYQNFVYGVQGDQLLIGQYAPQEVVQLKESTPISVAYEVDRVAANGQFYQFNYDLRLVSSTVNNAVQTYLAGHNTAVLNGLTIQDIQFSLNHQ